MIVLCSTDGPEEVVKVLEDIANACEAALGIRPLTKENRDSIKSLASFALLSLWQIQSSRGGQVD